MNEAYSTREYLSSAHLTKKWLRGQELEASVVGRGITRKEEERFRRPCELMQT